MSVSLQRFLDAQDPMYDGVKAELGAGRKTGHWMWFVFPQVAGLGASSTARFYVIVSMDEAVAYADHSLLGVRLRECAKLLLSVSGRSAEDMLGAVDAMKLHSSMTLFQSVAPDEPVYGEVLASYFEGSPDAATQRILAAWRSQASGPGGGAGLDIVEP